MKAEAPAWGEPALTRAAHPRATSASRLAAVRALARGRTGSAVLLLVGLLLPLALEPFRLEMFAKYLCLAFPAVGIVLIWGHTGMLSLGQGLFFGMGSYFMAMFLKLEATGQSDSAQALAAFYGSSLPDFMVWNSVESLPWFWKPFHSLPLTVLAILVVPPLLAFAVSYPPFRRRVGNVYFSIITLALASVASIVIIGQQGYTGGVNGITDFRTFTGIDLEAPRATWTLYYVTLALLVATVWFGRTVIASRLGKILVAVRDREDRVRFSGYDPAMFKAAIFAVAALFASLGGALFTLQVGLASPSLVGIVPSVEMVICAAVGGRLSLAGAVVGTLLVHGAKTFFSERFPGYWLYFIGGLFMAVVVFLPTGLAGVLHKRRARVEA
jgi:urea transport system permease protein